MLFLSMFPETALCFWQIIGENNMDWFFTKSGFTICVNDMIPNLYLIYRNSASQVIGEPDVDNSGDKSKAWKPSSAALTTQQILQVCCVVTTIGKEITVCVPWKKMSKVIGETVL